MNHLTIKVMKRPDLTDEEIRSHMSFEKLMKLNNSRLDQLRWHSLLIYSTGALVVIALVTFYVLFQKKDLQPSIKEPAKIIVSDNVKTLPNENTPPEKIISETPRQSVKVEDKTKISPKIEINKSASQFTEAMPVEGYPALYAYFDRELKYPGDSTTHANGTVTVSFIISYDGKPKQIKIENSLGEAFDKECIRVIVNMPSWQPATIDGKPVDARLSVPLTFKHKN